MKLLWRLVSKIHTVIEHTIHGVLTILIYLAITIVIGYYFGWLERWIWFILETEAKKILNSTKVTMGSFEIDWTQLLQGKITLHASNVVIHTPKRNVWSWESPLIARVGKASVECNAVITVFHVVFFRIELPIEAYTIVVSDVQVFVERRDSVINVYLLNPTLVLPPPPSRQTNDDYAVNSGLESESGAADGDGKDVQKTSNNESHSVATASIDANDNTFASTTNCDRSDIDGSDTSNEQANILVNEMLHAVQDLGRAATRGQLPGAIKQQGLELVDRLRGFRQQDNLEEGLRVMQQVGKVAVESLQSAPKLILPKPDSNKTGKPVYIRVGRIAINDMRIFTKDSWIYPNNKQEENHTIGTPRKSVRSTTTTTMTTKNTSSDISVNNKAKGSWNKPIFIQRMVVRASELAPPMSMKDEDGLPAIYQNVDRVAEIVWRRLLAEMAKSNTGKLFSTAMGEVLSVMITNRHLGNATTTITGSSSAADLHMSSTPSPVSIGAHGGKRGSI